MSRCSRACSRAVRASGHAARHAARISPRARAMGALAQPQRHPRWCLAAKVPVPACLRCRAAPAPRRPRRPSVHAVTRRRGCDLHVARPRGAAAHGPAFGLRRTPTAALAPTRARQRADGRARRFSDPRHPGAGRAATCRSLCCSPASGAVSSQLPRLASSRARRRRCCTAWTTTATHAARTIRRVRRGGARRARVCARWRRIARADAWHARRTSPTRWT